MNTLNLKAKSKQRISIVDCEYLYKTSDIPNYRAMKLYSYHEQLGNQVILVNQEYQLTGNHDMLYLIRELRTTPFPPGDLLDDPRTILIGKEFEIFEDSQDIPLEAAVCRPNYIIYEYDKPTIYSKASFVQLFHNDKLLKFKQDWHRENSTAVLVVDTNLWDAPAEHIANCLGELVGEQNVLFQHPIKLRKLLDKQVMDAFLKLKLAKFYKIRYNNNIGEDYQSVAMAVDILHTMKQRFIYLNLSSIPVKIITKDHWAKKENIYYDFERCLKIMTYAQKQKVRINFKYPKLRLSSPSWQFFEFFKTWSNHYHTLCYLEALLKGSSDFHSIPYSEILSQPRLWTTAKIKQAVHLIANYPDLMNEYGFTGWGGVYSSTAKRINFTYVKEKAIEDNLF